MDYGTLRVTTPDGQVREYPITMASVVVGRSEGTGVVIDHVSVSRRHALLHLSDEGLAIEDLGSANGSFIGSQRIAANTKTKVDDGQSIRFGDVEAHFLSPNSTQAQDVSAAGRGPAGDDSQGTIGVSLASPASPVAVGQATTATVVVQNRGAVVDQLTISVVDLPASWVRISRPTISLVAGARDEVTIVIQPPRSPESTAGEHPFSVAVVSGENGREVRVLGTCTILPFDGFTASLQQQGGGYQVAIENQGNATMTYALSVTSDADNITSKLDRDSVELAPGGTIAIPLEVAAKGRPLVGPIQVRQFRVHVKPARGTNPEATSDGQVTVKPPLRYWKVPVAALLLLVLFGGGGYGYAKKCGDNGWPGCSSNNSKAASPSPTVAGGATAQIASPTAKPTGLSNGATAVVVNSPAGSCLRVRQGHTRVASDPQSKVLGELCNDKKVKITSDKVEAEDFVWWSIDDGAGLKGWAAEKQISTGEVYLQLSQ